MSIEQEKYRLAREKVIGAQRVREGIGTLSEKTVHAVLKNYYEPDEDKQEIPVDGMVADIFSGEEIIEIQTRAMDRMRKKLEIFLPRYPVTLVYPVPRKKWLIWIDEETGELSKPRQSPKTGTVYDAFKELYKIKPFLTHPNLRIKIVLLDMEEYRLLNGWSRDKKKGSCRYDRIPMEFAQEIIFEQPRDYLQLIPYPLEEPFDRTAYAKAVHIKKEQATLVLHILHYLDLLERTGKKGNSYLYRVKDTA